MLSLLLITALAVQYPPPASKPATDTTAQRRTTMAPRTGTQATPRDTTRGAAVSRMAFHDRMRELWSDHIDFTRQVIVSVSAGLPDTAEVTQRLLRNQDEIGDAIKPYYGDAAGSQLASLLRNHIQLAAKALVASKGTNTAMQTSWNTQDSSGQYLSNRMSGNRMGGDTVMARSADTTQGKINSQYPTTQGRMNDTTKAARVRPSNKGADTTHAMNQPPKNRVTGDTISARLPSGQYGTVKQDTTAQSRGYAQSTQQTQGYAQSQGQVQVQGQAGQVDSVGVNQAIAALKANGDSIATFLSQANPRGFARETLRGSIQMHIQLLLQEVTAHLKKDWSGSLAAFDESRHQVAQMADMLSEGIMKQFPSRFSTKATTVSSR